MYTFEKNMKNGDFLYNNENATFQKCVLLKHLLQIKRQYQTRRYVTYGRQKHKINFL